MDREALLNFVLSWISKRTGFPIETMQETSRLLDDLNLDSIKVGELVANMSAELGTSISSDASEFAKETIGGLVEAALSIKLTGPIG